MACGAGCNIFLKTRIMENGQHKDQKKAEQQTAYQELYGKDSEGGVEKGKSKSDPEGPGDFGGAAASPGAGEESADDNEKKKQQD